MTDDIVQVRGCWEGAGTPEVMLAPFTFVEGNFDVDKDVAHRKTALKLCKGSDFLRITAKSLNKIQEKISRTRIHFWLHTLHTTAHKNILT